MNPPLILIKKPVEEPRNDFLSAYLSYSADTEVPTNFHRWSMLTALGAFLGRQFYFSHGEFDINPNMYTMLIGSPGTRKSTAIKLVKRLLTEAGYSNIAADKTSKEKFLLDLSGDTSNEPEYGRERRAQIKTNSFLDANLWGDTEDESLPDRECFIMADELNDFMGNGNIEFISLLGSLWDYNGTYRNRIKSGRSISIKNPTINILAGNTPTGFSMAFPSEILGQGFFSRILLIYGEPNGRRITFPARQSPEATKGIVEYLRLVKAKVVGPATVSSASSELLDKIYKSNQGIDDVRFESYSNRRFSHLLKLCLICAASRISTEIIERDIIYANTILKHAEHSMPRALGEFGKSRHGDVSHKIIQLAQSMNEVLTFKEIWRHVSNDLERIADLSTLLQNLVAAEKLISIPEGFLPRRKLLQETDSDSIDFSMLTIDERKFISL